MKKMQVSAKLELTIQDEFSIMTDGIADGKLLPVIVPLADVPEKLIEIIRTHNSLQEEGFVNTIWGFKKGILRNEYFLYIEFARPVEYSIILDFDTKKHMHLIDHIVDVRVFYLYIKTDNQESMEDFAKNSLLIQVHGSFSSWDKFYYNYCYKHIKKSAQSKQAAKDAANEYIKNKRLNHLGFQAEQFKDAMD